MLKQRRQLFEALFLITDLFVVSLAWLAAYWLRFSTDWIPVAKGVPDFSDYAAMLIFIWPVWAGMYLYHGLYRPMRAVRRGREILLLINANVLSLLVFMALTYLLKEKSVQFSRLVFLYFGVLALVGTIFERFCIRSLLREVRRRGYNLRYLLVIGSGEVAADIIKRLREHKELGIQLVGCLVNDRGMKAGPSDLSILGTYEDLSEVLRAVQIDQVLVGLSLQESDRLPEILGILSETMVDVKIIPDLYRFISLGGYIEEFEGLPAIGIQEAPINLFTKRVLDICFASLLLILFAPFMIIIAILIKLTSKGPITYLQERVSYDGTPFKIIKFRTMYLDAEKSGPGWTKERDSRVTPIGRVLRSTSLDELPQLINVLKGDMSIVGPRPERPIYIEEFRRRIPRYMLRHKVPAGMTGWAQVHGWRGDTSIDKRIEYDLYYIENWSLLLDLKILFLTLWRGFRNNNAY